VLRRVVVLAALAAVLLPSTRAGATELVPGVTYKREVIRTIAGRVVLYEIVAPAPGGLYALKPVLSNERVTGLERVSAMQKRLSRRATLAGVNGDLFTPATGQPNSLLVRANVLATKPITTRSSLGIGLDGLLHVGEVGYWGQFRVDGFPAHPFFEINRTLNYRKGVALFTPLWGPRTPWRHYAKEYVLANVGPIHPNTDVRGQVVAVRRGSNLPIPAGGAVLQATGVWKSLLNEEARRGRWLTLRGDLKNWWDGVRNAIGGGPVLVRDGVAIKNAGEDFTSDQLARHPRTAVGQRADGHIVLLVADGRSSASVGLTMAQLANQMVRLGAVTAMALDSGGSSTIAFDGHVFNHPSDGTERFISDALMVYYYGAFSRKPRWRSFSPNGDGYEDVQRLYAKFVRTSSVHLQLLRPDGVVKWEYTATRGPGTITKDLSDRSFLEGTWRWIVSGVDGQGRASQMERRFVVNKTLGFLTLSKTRMVVRTGVGGRERIGFRLTNVADVRVTIRRPSGRIVRHLKSLDDQQPGSIALIWNGRNDAGGVVRGGTYVAYVRAINGIGTTELQKAFVVRRIS
jgi:hypothetical protein